MPSGVIHCFVYDDVGCRLTVTFVSGEVYDYNGVPPEVVAAFRAAGSKGQFFGPNIRDRFPYRRVGKDIR